MNTRICYRKSKLLFSIYFKLNTAISQFFFFSRVSQLENSLETLTQSRDKKILTLESTVKEMEEQKKVLNEEIEVLKIKVLYYFFEFICKFCF